MLDGRTTNGARVLASALGTAAGVGFFFAACGGHGESGGSPDASFVAPALAVGAYFALR